MAIKNAQYKITKETGEDIYHFQTSDKMIEIVDSNDNVVGNFKELGMEGKVVESGSVKDLAITGIYQVRNLTGMPEGYQVDKISILSVTAIGKVGSPIFISYDLMSQSGDVYHNTVYSGTESGWTNGGKSLKNVITTLSNELGDTSRLNTTAKTSLVNAVNELYDNNINVKSDLNSLTADYGEFKKHNHNEYVNKNGDTIVGDIKFKNNKFLQGISTTGNNKNLIGVDDNNNLQLGDRTVDLNVHGKTVTFNGKKLWHEDNDGAGSGLDADYLGGVSHKDYANLNVGNDFKESVKTQKNFYAGGSLFFGTDYSERHGGISGNSAGEIRFYNKKSSYHQISPNGTFMSTNSHELNATHREVTFRIKLSASDGGMGFYRNNNSKYLGIYNWGKGKRVGFVDENTSEFHFDEPIHVTGRKVFLQSSTPTGSIPTGSIWIA